MTASPLFSYFIEQDGNRLQEDDALWRKKIPMDRRASRISSPSISYGDYFTAVRSFLESNDFNIICSAVFQCSQKVIHPEEIDGVRVYLVKHGEFYHPSRIDVACCGSHYSFVLNVALSDAGKTCIERECRVLEKLQKTSSQSFVPQIYGKGGVGIIADKTVKMFIGAWFAGYHEFHISGGLNSELHKDGQFENERLIVWDAEKGNFYLTPQQTLNLYRQAAMIMTSYYNLETFEQILPWHHAAGDFVVKVMGDAPESPIDLKLITVRQYASQIGSPPGEEAGASNHSEMMLDALLLFFLNLSIRMRLDRRDGVGDIVWADDTALYGTVDGFFDGLKQKKNVAGFQANLADGFQAHFSSYALPDLYELSGLIIDSYHPSAPDIPVIKENIENHLCVLINAAGQKVL